MAELRKTLPNFTAKDNTLTRDVKDNPADRISLEIGDSKQPSEFLPQAKIKRWDNEVNLSVRRQKPEKKGLSRQRGRVPTVDIQSDQVIYDDEDESVHIYEKPEIGDDGGLEIELHLKHKPESNRFDFSIQTKGLNFIYQPELTKEEIKKGATRPENVVGSYAVYHATKKDNVVGGKEYKTGKFCHIYRPHITDADGNETWGELEINEQSGILTVIVPQAFLDTAAYPVVVDPTFGYTSIGGTLSNSIATGAITGTIFQAPENGTVTKISSYVNTTFSSFNHRAVIYDASSLKGNQSVDLRSVSAGENSIGGGGAWYDWTTGGTIVLNDFYFLGIWGDYTGYYYDSDATYDLYFDFGNTYNSITDPVDPHSATVNFTGQKLSIYATYTASAGGTDVNAERDAETHGQDTANTERSAEVDGQVVPILTAAQDGADIDLTWTYG